MRKQIEHPLASAQTCAPKSISFTLTAARRLCLLGLLVSAFCFVGCGKRRPPQPPIERVPQRTEDLTGIQRGNQIILAWPAPRRNASDSDVQSIRRIDVYRLAEQVSSQLPLTEEEFAARSTLVGSVNYDDIKSGRDPLTYIDNLELAGELTRLRYAVRYVNAAGQRAAFSNFLLIEPAARIARPPSSLVAIESEAAIKLSWQPLTSNIDNSTPVNVLGFNVYRIRSDATESEPAPINSELISEPAFADKSFRFGEQATYFVRAVSLGTGGKRVESLDSNRVIVSPRDVYPPAPPTSITTAAAPGRLSIFFPANAEPDVAGYNIYRSEDPELPKDKWTRLNADLLTRTTFQDDRVEPGKKYFYYLTVVDLSGNTSPPSEVLSETAP